MSEPLEVFRAKRDRVVGQLRALCEHAERIGAGSLASRLGAELVLKLEQERFHLVVVGEFNHGKTSLVNALLGQALLPVGVTPTTAVIHEVRYGATAAARVAYDDGSHAPLPLEDVARFALRHEPEAPPGGEGQDPARREVHHLELEVPVELLREHIVLVDTPGVNDLCLQRADITFKYIPQSDAVLFVLDAGQPLKESERQFLQDKLIGQSRDKIVFVVAKADIWSEADRAEALRYIRDELGRLVPAPALFAVSPERALRGADEPSGLPALLSYLTSFLAEERGRIMLDNALGEGLEASRAIERSIDARRRACRMTSEELDRRIVQVEADLLSQDKTMEQRRITIREEVSAIRSWAGRDLERFCDDVVRQLPAVVDEAPIDDVKLYLAGFLETTFARWAEAEAQEIAQALEALAERMVALLREDAHDAAVRLSANAGEEVPRPDLTIDTFGYDVGVFALFTLGVGMLFSNALLGSLLTVAAPVLALYLRSRVELETRERAKEQAEKALREAAAKLRPKLDEMVEAFAARLEAWMLEAGRELHREMIDVLRAARRSRDERLPDADRDEAECSELGGRLTELRAELEAARAALWPDAARSSAAAPASGPEPLL
jgi:GTPase SAR1 family protein